MLRLAAIMYVLVAAALAGTVVTALLSMGIFDRGALAGGAAAGAAIAIPAAWLIARQLYALTRQ